MVGLLTPRMRDAAYSRPMPGEGGEGGEQGEGGEGGEYGANPGGEDEQPNVTPEEQAQYDDFMDKALQLAYNAKFFPQLLERITKASSPVEGLAAVTVAVVKRVADSGGQKYGGDVVFKAGTELLEDLAQTASKAGTHDFTEQELEGALYRAMDMYREQSGDLGQDPNIQADFGQLVEADRAGTLDQIVPGLAEKFGQGQQPEAAQQQQPRTRGMMNGVM